MATVLLTGAGGAAIPDLIKHLKGLGHRVLTCDMNPQAPGLFLGDGGFVVPPATRVEYTSIVANLCESEWVDVLIPLVDEELAPLKRSFVVPCKVLAPQAEFVETCLDKYNLMSVLKLHNLPTPIMWRPDSHALRLPVVVKPRIGRGGRGVRICLTPQDWYKWLDEYAIGYKDFWFFDYMCQEYIEGPEYTVSVVCDQRNMVHAVVPKEIILKQSSTKLAVTRRNDKIDALCRRIAEALNPCGPFNVQLKLRDGEPYVFEINPRFSGTVNLTIAAGCDEVGGLIELALGRPYTFGEWREGVVLVRQTHDGIMSEEDFNQRAPKGRDCQ